MQWCQNLLHRIGHTLPIAAAEFFHGGTEVIPDWYEHFVRLVRGHVGAQDLPLLDLAPRPFMVGVDEVV